MNIYPSITERIVCALKEGVIPWRMTWQSGLPKSLTGEKEYRGINILLLGMAGFTSRYWVTFNEAKRLGGFVKRGEKGTAVYFWHWRTEDEIERLKRKTGRDELSPCTSFQSIVFNLDQVEGIERPSDDVPCHSHTPIEAVEELLVKTPQRPRILEGATESPSYWPSTDEITMPNRGQFEKVEHYYAALFHELIHATGHSKRLYRLELMDADRNRSYSFEELVAEFGAAFLCSMTGISAKTEELSAAYIKGWVSALQNDTRLLFKAASAAQKAVDYLRGLNHPEVFEEAVNA